MLNQLINMQFITHTTHVVNKIDMHKIMFNRS